MFEDRESAGRRLADELSEFREADSLVVALPRGGVQVAVPIARALYAPLEVIITRKIGHPDTPEYAIAAVTEEGNFLGSETELSSIEQGWLEKRVREEQAEAKRRRVRYGHNANLLNLKGKVVILVDDGAATGLTLRLAALELRSKNPKSLIIAVPVCSSGAMAALESVADRVVTVMSTEGFRGAIGAHYESFPQLTDEEVIALLSQAHHLASETPSAS